MPSPRRLVPFIVSCALFMQQLDATAVATSLPAMGRSLHVTPLVLHVAITAYLFALAIFLPVSGWAADRFGQKRVFRSAIAIFTLGSIFCALAGSLDGLVLARIVQGFGGALMVPVARLILVRSAGRSEAIQALAVMSMTATIGPAAGPLLGGAISTYSSWRWIFWINVPMGLVGIICTTLFVAEAKAEDRRAFDGRGFALTAAGLGGVMYWVDAASSTQRPSAHGTAVLLAGVFALVAYVVYSRRVARPIIDLRVFSHPAFSISLVGGSIFRISIGALPFLLPLLLQQVFHDTPLQSGATTFVAAIGSFGMRAGARRILRAFGFRTVLIWNTLLSNLFLALCAVFEATTPRVLIMLILLLGGVFRALEFTSLNAMSFADVPDERMSDATSLSQIAQRLSQSFGVALAAFLLGALSSSAAHLPVRAFSHTFLAVAVLSSLSVPLFVFIAPDAGADMTQHRRRTAGGRTGSGGLDA